MKWFGKETSMVRPSLRSLPALIVSVEASGLVPASVLDGGNCDLSLDGGEKEGSFYNCKSFSDVFSASIGDLRVILFSYGVPL
jgi:hypothetical protein